MMKTPILLSTCIAVLLLTACATHVEVDGAFPKPLSKKMPLSSLVVFDPAFSNYVFQSSEGREVSIAVGQTQVELFTAVTNSLFSQTNFTTSQPGHSDTDIILVPHIEEVQISMPYQTKLNVYEVWIKYNMQVFDQQGQPVADWIMSAYGKTPTRFLKSASDALHQAAIVALRDAGAHFIIGFGRVPEISEWLRQRSIKNSTAPQQEQAGL
ncbi:MAG TPA: hypothetical protein DCF62_14495 [Porticoccaceae bacterium]|nr:hypothetical protein [Porticoccaceae bacterium]